MRDRLSPVRPVHGVSSPGTVSPFQSTEVPAHYGFASDLKRERADSSDLQRPTGNLPMSPNSAFDSSSNIYASTATARSTSLDVVGPPSYDTISYPRPTGVSG